MRFSSCVAFLILAAATLSAQTETNCVREGEWTKCGVSSSSAAADSRESTTGSSSSVVLPTSVKVARPAAAQNLLQHPPQPHRVADGKFWLAVAAPQVLNAAYRLKFGSCYPTRCVEGDGLTPNQHWAVFAGLNGLMGAMAYKAKKEHSRFWAPIALMLTPFSIYDIQHRPN